MKNKTKTYILLAFVIGVWGVIGYKIMSALNPETPKIAQSEFNTSFTPKTNTTSDTFSIKITKRDPFLGTLQIKNKMVTKNINKAKITWLPIIYHGNVIGQGSRTNIFIVSINGEEQLMKLDQTVKEVKLIRGNKNEITLSYKGERKTIAKI